MIEESDSEYEENLYDASDDENYIPAANGGTGWLSRRFRHRARNDH